MVSNTERGTSLSNMYASTMNTLHSVSDKTKAVPGTIALSLLKSGYTETKKVLDPYPNCKIIRKTSMEAVEGFEDESLDFVYIDANHEFRYIAEDLFEWTKKVKKGGIVSGHDYFYLRKGVSKNFWHVAHVLNAYTQAFNIQNWYVLGSKNSLPGEKRDKYRSWMFVKQ